MKTAPPEAPELLPLKLRVSALTTINLHAFVQWYFQHWYALEDAFINSGELLEHKRIWLREVFVAERELNSRPAPRSPPSHAEGPTIPSAREPVGFSKLFRRRA